VTVIDRYPTRRDARCSLLPRVDPVVYHSDGTPEALDPVQIALFETDGFVTFKELIDPPTVEDLRSIFEVHRVSSKIRRLVEDPRLTNPVRQILGSDVYVHQTRVNLKPGFEGREFSWHSDFETWHAEDGMPAARAVSISIALESNYTFNGSLMLIPGSHQTFVSTAGETPPDHYRTSLRAQTVGVPDRDSLRVLVERGGIATVTGDPGSAVLFDCNAMHGSAGNMTPYPRSNIFIVYNSVENTLLEPFSAPHHRPSFIASQDFTPVG
jgi:ectoine hydroxylase